MTEFEIVHIALDNLHKHSGIAGRWDALGPAELDGQLELMIENHTHKFNTEIKRELRNHQLPKIINQAKRFGPLMVVANSIFPKIKEELRHNGIAYLETNGNVWIKQDGILLWLDMQKPLKELKGNINRAFTKTGLKVIFHFLLHPKDVNRPYREIAKMTGVALGNINHVITGLKEMGFLLKLNKETYQLQNKKALLDKWTVAYGERLKPALHTGTFRFLKEADFNNWKDMLIPDGKTLWGGEPAGDLLTNYLRPAELSLYTTETRNDLIKNYRLIPDDHGHVKTYQKFWQYDAMDVNVPWPNARVVPPLLAYADLINTNDRRCTETAQKIYDEYIQDKL